MPPPVIRYAITDRHLRAADECDPIPSARPKAPAAAAPQTGSAHELPREIGRLERQARRLREGAVDYLQLREKDLAPTDLRTLALALRAVLPAGSRPRLLLNLGHSSDPAPAPSPAQQATLATALAISADGLHLPAGTPAPISAAIRAAFARACRSTPILSTSAHTLAEVAQARAAGLDLILFGPVFGKTVFERTPAGKLVTPAAGLDALAAAVHAAGPVPVLALGGVTPANAEACLAAGARGLAGIRLFL